MGEAIKTVLAKENLARTPAAAARLKAGEGNIGTKRKRPAHRHWISKVPSRGGGAERCLTGGSDQSDLGADRSLSPFAEGPHLDDVGSSLWQRDHGGRVNGSRHLVVASALLSEQHLQDTQVSAFN